MDPPSEEHVRDVCLPNSFKTCRYLMMDAAGWSCAKLTDLKQYFDYRVAMGSMRAKGDNCEGRGSR